MKFMRYNKNMSKPQIKRQADGSVLVWDAEARIYVPVAGANAMVQSPLPLDPRIDLTKPIYDQVLERLPGKRPALRKKA